MNISLITLKQAGHKYADNSSARQRCTEVKPQTHISRNLEAAAVLHQQKNMPDFTPVTECRSESVKLEYTAQERSEKHFLLQLISIIL